MEIKGENLVWWGDIWEISVSFIQGCCEPKIALTIVYKIKKNKKQKQEVKKKSVSK